MIPEQVCVIIVDTIPALQANVISPETFYDSHKFLLRLKKNRLVHFILYVFAHLKFLEKLNVANVKMLALRHVYQAVSFARHRVA